MTTSAIAPDRLSRLRRTNLLLGLLHVAQGAAVLALGNGFALPVTGSFMTGPPGSGLGTARTLFHVSFAVGVAAFLFVSAAAHFLIASPRGFRRYTANLERGRNDARWFEYSISASVMIVLIAMLTGISDVAALGALFAATAAMIFFGLVQERYERPGGSLLPFWLGSLIGAVPWVVIGVYLVSPGVAAEAPGFVYGIYVSLFVFFNSFAVNMWLQYRKVGRWSDYVYGEKVYALLSLIAKSLLAWQVFAGTLAS
ncbi:MAG: hypothetical protein A2Z12_02530 [Actinobacteria bacterium RBG_16_68_21]|nr:MAG: hypothetical protein A2Z12_02530 [Actinobacteria bacterium RBG_16_68_21]